MAAIMTTIAITIRQYRQQVGNRLHLEFQDSHVAHLHLLQALMVLSPMLLPVNRRNPDPRPTVVNISLRNPNSDTIQLMIIEIMAMDGRVMDLLLVMVATEVIHSSKIGR
jgi:hypothetical protein